MKSAGYICVPVSTSLYNELVLRVGDPDRNVTPMIEHAIESFLERTQDDGNWSEAYFDWRALKQPTNEFRDQYGDPDKGYFWTPIFLPNGTKILMPYAGQKHFAEIRNEKIYHDGKEIASPSALASKIARGTSRNAWVSLQIKRPSDSTYRLADELRREGARK